MNLDSILTDFNHIKNGIYIKKNNKVLAVVSPDEKSVGYSYISINSRTSFTGLGVILTPGFIKETLNLEKESDESQKFDDSADTHIFIKPWPNKWGAINLDYKPEQINDILNSTLTNRDDIIKVLDQISDEACGEYTCDTIRNKIRNFNASVNLSFNPLQYKKRKGIRKKIKEEVNEIHKKLTILIAQYETDHGIKNKRYSEINEYEKLLNMTFDQIKEIHKSPKLYETLKKKLTPFFLSINISKGTFHRQTFYYTFYNDKRPKSQITTMDYQRNQGKQKITF